MRDEIYLLIISSVLLLTNIMHTVKIVRIENKYHDIVCKFHDLSKDYDLAKRRVSELENRLKDS